MDFDPNEEEDRKKVLENRIIYSLPVRLGLWNEDLALKEERAFITAYKKEHCELLIQKTKKMLRNLLKPTILTEDSPYILYGRKYQFKVADFQINLTCEVGVSNALFLTGLITDKEIDMSQQFRHGSMLTVSNTLDPCVRNTFKIIGADRNKDQQPVLYGDDVFLQISEASLYVQCENSTIDTFGEHLKVRLSESPDIYCRFKFLYWEPLKRYEAVGAHFGPDSRVVIEHTATGKKLIAHPNRRIPTFFGPECMVSCGIYRDTHKMETAENFWKILGTPKSNTSLYVRAAKGDQIPDELLL